MSPNLRAQINLTNELSALLDLQHNELVTRQLNILDDSTPETVLAKVINPNALISQLVLSFFENNPYYPLPLADLDTDDEIWNVFSAAYLEKAAEVFHANDSRDASLP